MGCADFFAQSPQHGSSRATGVNPGAFACDGAAGNIALQTKGKTTYASWSIFIKCGKSATFGSIRIRDLSDYIERNAVLTRFEVGQSWAIPSPIEQSIKRKIEAVGTPFKDWDIRINYGIKTGSNDAFIIDGKKKDELIAQDPKSAEIIRPILRGTDIKRYGYKFADIWVILAKFGSHEYLPQKYPL